MNKTVVVYIDDSTPISKKHKLNCMQNICFKPMIEYVLEIAGIYSESNPYILTKNPYFTDVADKFEQYNVIGEIESITNTNDTEYLIIINAASPLITTEAIDNSLNFMSKHNLDGVYTGEGMLIVNKNLFKYADTLVTDAESGAEMNVDFYEEFCDETMVCSDRIDIAYADRLMRLNINFELMDNGVTIIDPESTYIEKSVIIGEDTIIYPGTFIEGNTVIGTNCEIYSCSNIKNTKIGNNVVIKNSTIIDSSIDDFTNVGPYAYIRPNSVVGKNVKVGDFVELKKANIGDGTKISHLTYVGDANVGKNVNFGCGTVTVNYDGKNKFLTEIGDNVFIGCNTNLVSPVKVGHNAFIAAGSTITDEVPENGFAIARERQINKTGWTKPKDRIK